MESTQRTAFFVSQAGETERVCMVVERAQPQLCRRVAAEGIWRAQPQHLQSSHIRTCDRRKTKIAEPQRTASYLAARESLSPSLRSVISASIDRQASRIIEGLSIVGGSTAWVETDVRDTV